MAKKQKSVREHLLTQSKKALKRALLPVKVRKDRNKLEGWILDREDEIDGLEIKISELKSDENLNPSAILEAIDALEEKKVRVEQGKDLLTELFVDQITVEEDEDDIDD